MLIDCAFVTVRRVTKAALLRGHTIFKAPVCLAAGSLWDPDILVWKRALSPHERPEAKPEGNERPGSRRPSFPASRWSGARASFPAVKAASRPPGNSFDFVWRILQFPEAVTNLFDSLRDPAGAGLHRIPRAGCGSG